MAKTPAVIDAFEAMRQANSSVSVDDESEATKALQLELLEKRNKLRSMWDRITGEIGFPTKVADDPEWPARRLAWANHTAGRIREFVGCMTDFGIDALLESLDPRDVASETFHGLTEGMWRCVLTVLNHARNHDALDVAKLILEIHHRFYWIQPFKHDLLECFMEGLFPPFDPAESEYERLLEESTLYSVPLTATRSERFLAALRAEDRHEDLSRSDRTNTRPGTDSTRTTTERAADATIPEARHSETFSCVHWYDGVDYTFTLNQSLCVRVLWAAMVNKTPALSGPEILKVADVHQERFDKVFTITRNGKQQKHPAWGTMIVSANTKGLYRLNVPQNVPQMSR